MIRIVDCSTGEEITREMNDAEYEKHLVDQARWDAERKTAE